MAEGLCVREGCLHFCQNRFFACDGAVFVSAVVLDVAGFAACPFVAGVVGAAAAADEYGGAADVFVAGVVVAAAAAPVFAPPLASCESE